MGRIKGRVIWALAKADKAKGYQSPYIYTKQMMAY